jgi:hypothetical protein
LNPKTALGLCHQSQLRVIYADREEVIRPRDLYYLPPGHTGMLEEDYEAIEFSPPAGPEQVLDVNKRNAATAQTAPA